MNRTQLIGNLVSDVEFKQSASGTEVARLRLAVKRNFKNQQNEYDSDFINCVAFGKTAEIISQYFNKGSKIAVDGRIQTGSGTTLRAAAELGRAAYGFEIKKDFYNEAKEKMLVDIPVQQKLFVI